MKYKMKCHHCGKDMIYKKDFVMELLGWVTMECPDSCDGEVLVPIDNPRLERVEEE